MSRLFLHKPRLQSAGAVRQDASRGRPGIALTPPSYGIDFVDQGMAAHAQSAPGSGLPHQLKAGIESLSGLAMDDVRVHYGSAKPAQVQALAYTQGADIHLAPGQERHLPHEAWHAVQQKQGRVQPTLQAKGVSINDDQALEREADTMGARARHTAAMPGSQPWDAGAHHGQPGILQAKKPAYEPPPTPKVIEDWKTQVTAATGAPASLGEITTTGDGAQIPGWGAPAGAAKNPAYKRNPLHEKALKAMQAYDVVDRKKLNIPILFSGKQSDMDFVQSLRDSGAFVDDKDPSEAPVGATYVVGKTLTDHTGKSVRQFTSSGIIVDNNAGQWTTMSSNDIGARTDAALQKVKFSTRTYDKASVIGWFVPENMQVAETGGLKPADFRDAYDQRNEVKHQLMDEDAQKAEALKFALTGHNWMGADWHGAEDFGYALKEETVIKDGEIQYVEKDGKRVKKKGKDVPLTKQVRERVSKPVTEKSLAAKDLAYKIYAGNPDKVRNPEDPDKKGSYFTTCMETATAILKDFGVDSTVFGGLMAPIFQLPKQAEKPRDTALFQYLKDVGAWVWGSSGFVPQQGDIFLSGSFQDTVNLKEKSRGLWSFQHVGVVANISANPDGTYAILSQDGGKGQAVIGEDKTGYTIRNYDPASRLLSGANPKMMIGVWRPALLKAALMNLPPEIKATLKGAKLTAHEAMVKPKRAKP